MIDYELAANISFSDGLFEGASALESAPASRQCIHLISIAVELGLGIWSVGTCMKAILGCPTDPSEVRCAVR